MFCFLSKNKITIYFEGAKFLGGNLRVEIFENAHEQIKYGGDWISKIVG